MSFSADRRRFLGTALAGAAIVAFDPLRGGWLTAAAAAEGPVPGAVALPDLDGELSTDPAALAAVADDFGHLVHRTPLAVLRPGSVDDVVALVRFANRHGIAVAARGQGHSTNGQSQVHAGVVIDMSTLNQVHEIRPDRVTTDAGVLWIDLARATLAHGLTPPVFTDYLDLSVGGTLNAGGIGGTSQRAGFQVDTVLALEVVTGTGQLVRCSPARNRALFESVLGSLGQLAVVVRATVRLVPAPTHARTYQLFYADLDTYLADQRAALAGGRFTSLEGQVQRTVADDGWEFFIDAAVYWTDTPPDDAAVTAGLRFDPARTVSADVEFLDWIDRLRPTVELLTQLGIWFLPHPWINLFLPASRTAQVVAPTLAALTLADTGQSPVLLYPFRPGLVRRRFVEVPDEPVAFLFAILRTTVPPTDSATLVARNRALYERARAAGGKRYPVGTVPFTPRDWIDHYGRDYPALLGAKAAWDPRRVLAPGQGIFGPPR
jgi:cytokinin dehydrogenase